MGSKRKNLKSDMVKEKRLAKKSKDEPALFTMIKLSQHVKKHNSWKITKIAIKLTNSQNYIQNVDFFLGKFSF